MLCILGAKIKWSEFDAVLQTEHITGLKAKEIYVDRGYRGHNYEGKTVVHVAGRGTRKLRVSIRKWMTFVKRQEVRVVALRE